jgi:hypothetical protein
MKITTAKMQGSVLYIIAMITIIILSVITLIVLLALWIFKALWNSWLFWAATLIITVLMFPFTAGMSAAAFAALLILRLFIIHMMVVK